jgi:RNA polymerase sigma factor (sigma-70 family)
VGRSPGTTRPPAAWPGTDGDVSTAFSQGRPDGLTLAYERFAPLVYTLALRSLGTGPDAEDVTQQVFVSAWRGRDTFEPGRGTLGGWLVAIARNKIADVLRERRRENRVFLQVAERAAMTALEVPSDRVVDRLVLADELAQLSEAQRLVMTLRPHARADRPGSAAPARHREEPHPPRPAAPTVEAGG